MKRIVVISIAAAAILVDGYVFGVWTDRWGNTATMERALSQLDRVPLNIGDWQGESLELGAAQAEQAGFAGHWLRRYERRQDGMAVNVMLACGRPGPLSVHTPDICYAGAGFVQSQPAAKYALAAKDRPSEFFKSMFNKPEAVVPANLRIFWSWRTADGW